MIYTPISSPIHIHLFPVAFMVSMQTLIEVDTVEDFNFNWLQF